jgi:hypothetical protein
LELGKLCYYTFINAYSVPRKYFFISSCGVGTSLAELIENPLRLKEGLILVWDDKCKKKITGVTKIELTGKLLEYVEKFDLLSSSKTY